MVSIWVVCALPTTSGAPISRRAHVQSFFFFELCRVLIVFFFFFPLSSDEIIQYVTDYCFSTLTRILREKDPFSQAGWFWPCRVPYSIYVGAMYAK